MPFERLQKLLAFEAAEEAKRAVLSWAKWIVGIVVAVAATLGIKTYVDIRMSIVAATNTQIEQAKGKADEAVLSFETQQTKALDDFQKKSDEAIARLDAQIEEELVSVSETGRQARLDILIVANSTSGPSENIRSVSSRARERPIGPGLSVSGINQTAGTICCIVQDEDGTKFILTTVFDVRDLDTGQDSLVVQPGTIDGGTEEHDVIGTVERATKLAALVRLKDDVEVYCDVPGIGQIRGIADVRLGQVVRKFGRTTGLSTGEVRDLDFRLVIDLGAANGGRQSVKGVLVTPFAAPGDAGSPVVNDNNELVGMHFAGSDVTSIFVPIKSVLAELNVKLVTTP